MPLYAVAVTIPEDNVKSSDGAGPPDDPQSSRSEQAEKKPIPFFPIQFPTVAYAPLQVLVGSLIGAVIILIAATHLGMLVPAQVANSLEQQVQNLASQGAGLRNDLELAERKNREYEARLGASSEQALSRMAEMQRTITALEQQLEAIRAAEWPPLTAAAQEALYSQLKELPAREVWVGYADSNGRALAKQFSRVFNRLNWPQKYDVLAVHDPQDGLWITPTDDFSDQVRQKIAQSTGLQFKLFPHTEQLPDAKQIGVIIGYRTPRNDADVP
jgi:hypothetical protein